jgi:hypothetical protein
MAKCYVIAPFWLFRKTDNATVRIVYSTIGIDRSDQSVDGRGLGEPFASLSHSATSDLQSRSVFPNRHSARDNSQLGSATPEIFRSIASVLVVPSRPCVGGPHESELSLSNRGAKPCFWAAAYTGPQAARQPESDKVGNQTDVRSCREPQCR